VIIEIRELMLKSVDTASREQLSKRKEATSTAAQQKQQQKQNGADGKLQIFVWDPGGFPTAIGEAHEQELMIFAAVEYDGGASLHVSQLSSQPRQCACIHMLKGR
jgi:hypothetical protein